MFFEEKRDFIDDKYVYWVCYVENEKEFWFCCG